MSRGMSNCNPGNIRRSRTRYKGEVRPSRDPEFKQFASLEWGYRAIFVLLHTYRVRYGLGSLDGMIARWAPPSENSTELYVAAVCGRSGLRPDERISVAGPQIGRLVAAMARQETGAHTTPDHIDDLRRRFGV